MFEGARSGGSLPQRYLRSGFDSLMCPVKWTFERLSRFEMTRNYLKSQREHVGQGYLKDRRNVLVKLRSVVRRFFTLRLDTLRLCEIGARCSL